MEELKECKLCPRNCNINRLEGKVGRCKAGKDVKVALSSLHYYEEPCISGTNGSGTVFFSGCNLGCKFCQNYEISQMGKGYEVSIEELANMFLELQEKGANNINLVTGFMFAPHIIEALKIAKSKNLSIPVIYNSSGYESLETLKMLDGYIDVYLPDFKYYYNELALKLSDCSDYFDVVVKAIGEMIKQVGTPVFDKNGIIKKGVIIRHLVLPNHLQNSKRILKYIKEKFPKNIYVSVMAQYFPSFNAKDYEDISRKLCIEEFSEIESYISKINLQNGYIQYLEENEEQYVPKFL